MLSYDPRQKEAFQQWLDECIEDRISHARAAIEKELERKAGLSAEEGISFFLMSQPPVPDDARAVSEQIFRWGITVAQFAALQKSLELPLFFCGARIQREKILFLMFLSGRRVFPLWKVSTQN